MHVHVLHAGGILMSVISMLVEALLAAAVLVVPLAAAEYPGEVQTILPPSQLCVDMMPPSGASSTLTVIQNPRPSFGWALHHERRAARQVAFRLVLNTTSGQGPSNGSPARIVWDTGVMMSTQSIGVEFGGPSPLVSDTDYQWTVQWQDERGAWSEPSAPARFSTGLLAPANADWIGTAWIGGLQSTDDRNQLRRSFSLPADIADVQRARCYISAPGGHETYLNGARLQNSVRSGSEGAALGPTVQFSSKIPYEVYDCTQVLRSGGTQNVLATTLGRGWFAMDNYPGLGYSTIGARSLRVLITAEVSVTAVEDATKTTAWRLLGDGAGWKMARGPLVNDHLFLGVVLDGRRETPGWLSAGFDDSTWVDVPILHGPNADDARNASNALASTRKLLTLNSTTPPLVALQIPSIRRLAPRTPISVKVTSHGVALADLGVNMAGTCEIVADDTSAANAGDVMLIRHAEGLNPAGSIDQTWLTGEKENSTYMFRADGTREVYSERFVYFGFRYLEVTGFPGGVAPPKDAITCWFTHSDLERSGTIDFLPVDGEINNTMPGGSIDADARRLALSLTRLQAAIVQSALSNYHSHPTDCPSREKRGWTGDGGHAAETLMLNFGMGAPYAKWLSDIDDASCPKHIVPNMAPGNFHSQAQGACFSGADPAWESGFVDVLLWHHRYYGDRSTLTRHWAAAQGSLAFLSRYSTNDTGLLTVSGYPATRLGDWCAPSGNRLLPDSGHHLSNVISGYFWIRQLEAMGRAALTLGNASVAADYYTRASRARTSFGKLYFDHDRGLFRDPQWVAAWGAPVMQTEQALALTLCLDLQDSYGSTGGSPSPLDRVPTPTEIVPATAVARAAAALAANVSGGLNVGMVGIKHVFSALAATGHGDVALAALASTEYPSFGYMLEQGEGTIWERWEGATNDLAHSSRNHVMLASPGQFLYQFVAGINIGKGGIAFDRVAISPTLAAITALGGVNAVVGTSRGAIAVSWRVGRRHSDLCGTATEKDSVGEPLHLDCVDASSNGTIAKINFASYGTPSGTCTDAESLTVDSTCNAPTSLSVAKQLCVGKPRCTLYANDTQFGGVDPCHGRRKKLIVAASCTGSCESRFELNVTVPVGSNATLLLPTRAVSNSHVVKEAGTAIYRDGLFLPTVNGVASVRSVSTGFEVVTGGGHYSFALLECGCRNQTAQS